MSYFHTVVILIFSGQGTGMLDELNCSGSIYLNAFNAFSLEQCLLPGVSMSFSLLYIILKYG